jgi:uncharacterized protein (TIGR02145 family)
MAFFTSCGGHDLDDILSLGESSSSNGGNGSLSSGGGNSSRSSSSGGGNSSPSSGGSCNIEDYKTVKIGSQIWMAENFNCEVSGSRCYNEDPANCAQYGRLYYWATAKTVCPSGWHLPSEDDWDILMRYVQVDNGGSIYYTGGSEPSIAKYLKATSGWKVENWTDGGNGEDKYGFAALPGGGGYGPLYDNFGGIGEGGGWWSTKEIGSEGSAYSRSMMYTHGRVLWVYDHNSHLNSVRCIKNGGGGGISSSSVDVFSSSSSGSKGNYIVNYKTKKIGDQTWMAENLDYAVAGSKCYDNNPANCAKYGRLYDWVTAMDLPASCSTDGCHFQINSKHRGVCPEGWHLPREEEWIALYNAGWPVGENLKATSGWADDGNGLDTHGFAALPGGYGSPDGYFNYVGYYGNWWSSSRSSSRGWSLVFCSRIGFDGEYPYTSYWNSYDNSYLFSVRCVQD